MVRYGTSLAVLLWLSSAALAAPDFSSLSADAQLIVNQVTGEKPSDTAICGKGGDEMKTEVVSATKSLYFSGKLSGEPRAAGTAAGDYLKALCQH